MEILRKFKQNGYFTAELYYLLSQKKMGDSFTEIIPSEYEKEINMTTQERLQNLNDIEVDNFVGRGLCCCEKNPSSVLAFTPKIIIFQNFKPNDKIIAKFSVKNIGKGPIHLRMIFKESSYFAIKPCGGQLHMRLAPGISASFAVTFTPVQYEDYVHKVTFYSDNDQYILALIGMGPRPLCNFPDEINFQLSPLKIEVDTSVTIQNLSVVPAGVTFRCRCPFSVQPKSLYLNPNEKAVIKVSFKTMNLGNSQGKLTASFETGETFIVHMSGSTCTVSVQLEKEVVRFFDTYNTLVQQQTIKITNKSNYSLTYMCMKNEDVYCDFKEKMKLATMFYNVKESESAKYTKLVYCDVLSSDEHRRVYCRIFYDEIQTLVVDESLHFENKHFTVSPIEGILWPNKATELTITFAPKEIGEFNVKAFLDFDGVSCRVPLTMTGVSVPPSISLNIETLDMHSVYINCLYNYEIVAMNKGDIDGMIVNRDVPPLFGSIIRCSPQAHCLRPGEKQIFVISFLNPNQGPFFEEINFVIRNTDVILKLYLKGEVIYPTITFSLPCLDFGTVCIGVPKTLELEVINESIVNVRGSVKISSDGPEISSILLIDYAICPRPKPAIPQWPREFDIYPCKIDLEPESRIIIKVTLTANLIRANQTSLELELEKSNSPPVILPITYNAVVPEITPSPDIHIRGCFVDFTYTKDIVLTSDEQLGYFTVEEDTDDNDINFEVDVLKKEGYIEPNSTLTLPTTIRVKALGSFERAVRLNLFGLSKAIKVCHISVRGIRPIVTCNPMALHWGQVKLLTTTHKTLTLCNDSPVIVYYDAFLLNKDSRWTISPSEGCIQPEEEKDLTVSLYLIDADTYANKMVIKFHKVKDILVPLSATGVGTSIVVGPEIDKINLNRHFIKIPLNCKVIMENRGSRLHTLEWNEHYKAPKTQTKVNSFFNMDPKNFKLAAGEKVELTLTGISYKATTIKEMWYLVGSIEGINKKELLLECLVTAEFVETKIELFPSFMELRYDFGPYSEYYKLTEIVSIKNVSKLPLDLEIISRAPFCIIHKSTYKIPEYEEHMTCCCIRYKESDINLQNILTEYSPKESKEFIDFLTNKPVEPHNKESLVFFNNIDKIKMVFNTTSIVEEHLEDQDVMKLQILFDTTKHYSLKSKVYCDLMRIRFKGHKNKDAVKVTGRINFPNIFITMPRVDFECVMNGSVKSLSFKIQNTTPLLVCYRFQWKTCSIYKISMSQPQHEQSEIGPISSDSTFTTGSFASPDGTMDVLPETHDTQENISRQEVLPKSTSFKQSQEDFAIHSDKSSQNEEYKNIQVIKKIKPMLDDDYNSKFRWIDKFPVKQKSKNNINDILQVIPHRGMLKPGESQYVHVMFKPTTDINVRAVLECEVLGGPSEMLTVTGHSSDLLYTISSKKINFKIRSSHELATEELIITNTAFLPFEYKTYLNEPKMDNEMQGTIRELLPPDKLLQPEEVFAMKIIVRPGVVGYFHRVFLLQIGHLPNIPIEVFGWGVIPQIYVTLPRSQKNQLDPELGYLAIPSLTKEYLEARRGFARTPNEHLNSPLIEKCFEDPDFKYDWHICSSWDGYPSTIDIDLAIERLLVIQHIKRRPEMLSCFASTKMGPIPGYFTLPYVIDFGVVITGSVVQCAADIINYGPIPTKLHFARNTPVPNWLTVKLCPKLQPGETGKLEVVFSPNSEDFTELEQTVETSFNFEVPFGVSIPIEIKAMCAVPYLVSNIKIIEFGSVRCGDKVICSVPLKNIGKPVCIWYVSLKLKVPGPPPIVLLDTAGKYEAEEGGWLSIAFTPTMEMLYEGVLIFRFHMNPNKLTIPISGRGIVPCVDLIGANVKFPPTLPWAETTDMYFGLTNPCPFPIELIIAHTDNQWKEEEEILKLLYKFYNKPDEMLVPSIIPGKGLPIPIKRFYQNLQDHVKQTLIEEAAAAKVKPISTKASVKAAAEAKKDKKSPKSKTFEAPKGSAPFRPRTRSEIILDQLKFYKQTGVDPLRECVSVMDDTTSDAGTLPKISKGILVFLHGSPCEEMQCQEMAYSIGKGLKIPTVNIDNCIIEALCKSNCPAQKLLVTALDETYQMTRKAAQTDVEDEANEEVFSDTLDEFEITQKKIEFLISSRGVATPRSKQTDKKKKKASALSVVSHTVLEALGSTTLFKMDLVEDLLTDFFAQPKFELGFIVDSLTSIMIKNAPLTLTTLLKCKRNITNIHLVLCQSDFSKWAQAYEESQRDSDNDENVPKIYDENEIHDIVSSFEDMEADEYENALPELKAVYIAHALAERRAKYQEKKGLLHLIDVKKEKKEIHSKSTLVSDMASDAKKKVKKEDPKGKASAEYALANSKYNEYTKNTYEQLINIANNWVIEECDVGYPLMALNGQVIGAAQKKKKSQTQMLAINQVSQINLADRGFNLILITCPCLQYKTSLVNSFKYSCSVQESLKQDVPIDMLQTPVKRKAFSILLQKTFPYIHHEPSLKWVYLYENPIKKCECNQLTDLHLLDDTTQDNVLNILSKWHCTCGKKLTSSATSVSESPSPISKTEELSEEEIEYYPQPLPLHKVTSSHAPEKRIVLQPGDLFRGKFSFSPQEEGNFSIKRYVEVTGWPESRAVINVNGICDMPRLDRRPKKMFANFVRRTIENEVYKVTYLDDLKVFEFGPIFIGANRVYNEDYTIDLKNASLITADVDIEFFEETSVFQINTTFISLEPGCRSKLTISAAPTEVGVHSVVLLFCVKDNPDIVTVKIMCNGVVPSVEILPLTKTIEYGKLLLYRRLDDRIIVKNDSILPIMWKIRNDTEFLEDFIIPQTTGIVPRYDNHVAPVTYIACNVGVISRKTLIIDIYDADGRGEPMIVEYVSLSAECYDVTVDCMHENLSETYLNYGNVKVNSTVGKEMYLLNRGKYNVYFKLKKVKDFPEPSLLRSFEASPESGMIPASLKLVPIEFQCTPDTSMNLYNVPAYICSLLDGSKGQVVVAKFPVAVTIASFYNTFTLFPLGELNFNVIAVGTAVMREVILNNTSKCPFTYEIILPEEYENERRQTAAVPPKGKDKIRNPPLRCGNFLIMNEDNLLPPGTSRTIQIQFFAPQARKFEETINFIIDDTCPAEAQGVPLKLVGTGAMPSLDIWNVDTTFREHLIVKNLSEYTVPESSPHCVFAENSVTLHFFCVTVNSTFTGSIDLYNNGLVPCALTMHLHYQENSNVDIFSLDKYETHIEPLLHKNLGIIFTPKALTEYRSVLEIRLKLLDNQEQSFKICLIGEGVIPRIQLVTPPLKCQNMSVLKFPVTCLGSVTNKVIRFKNISPVKSVVVLKVVTSLNESRPVFWITAKPKSEHMVIEGNNEDMSQRMKFILGPDEIAVVNVSFNPVEKGRASCDLSIKVEDNPYEYFTIMCECEAFIEDVILLGLEMLPMNYDIEFYRSQSAEGTVSGSTISKTKSRSATEKKKKIRQSSTSVNRVGDSANFDSSILKYILEFGGCELSFMQKRSVVMVNNSEKLYKFQWSEVDHIVVKPLMGYISPGEEKDIETIFFSAEPVVLYRELLTCTLNAISDDSLTLDMTGAAWDNRQIITKFNHNEDLSVNERHEEVLDEKIVEPTEQFLREIKIVLIYSATTSYIKYTCTLPEVLTLPDTFIYQTRTFDFSVKNTGKVPIKIIWNFIIDEKYPTRLDENDLKLPEVEDLNEESSLEPNKATTSESNIMCEPGPQLDEEHSKLTLFSQDTERDSVDTWLDVALPFKIEPEKWCLKPNESQKFIVTFSPVEAFQFHVKLKSSMDNLDPYDQNISCKLTAKSLIPYVHLDVEESDYLTSGRRKITVALPEHVTVLEYNVLGSGCYKKSFNVINPTSEAYEFIFEMVQSEDNPELIPVHCDSLKGFVEAGTVTKVTFTFSPTAPGVTESQWKFKIPIHNLTMFLLVVGIVREPEVVFVPTILVIRNSLVGFTTTNVVTLQNNEDEPLKFDFKGNSLCNESGKTPVIVEPEFGTLKPRSQTPIKVIYTPIQDGPLSFKIFCSITHVTKYLTLCVNALSYSVNPKITYYLIGNEHVLNNNFVTNIYLDRTASTYERTVPFHVKNNGSATFFFDWHYNTSNVKKYLQLSVEPKNGHVKPGDEIECILLFNIKKIPVEAFPITLSISDGPQYSILLYAEIEKPAYHFTCGNVEFGKCFINTPETTFKKNIALTNDDKEPIIFDLNFSNKPELYVDHAPMNFVKPGERFKISIYFRPKQVKEYEFKLQFWINSLCEEIITVRGEGIPLLFDLYEGCQKSFDLGHVKVGEKIVQTIEVMNHSKMPIDATFIFREMYPIVEDEIQSDTTSVCLSPKNTVMTLPGNDAGQTRVQMLQQYKNDKIREQIAKDIENALSSLKVIPNACTIKPYRKVPLKIQFKPVGMIDKLNVQLNMKVFQFERPLVRLSGCATGMSLSFNQNSLQFGRVRKDGCKILKVLLMNHGDFGARFWWQPLKSDEFEIKPLKGRIAAHTNVTFTITFRPRNHNPFIKVWASCNIENYKPLELSLYATCVDFGTVMNQNLVMECPVRGKHTELVVITNPTDVLWLVLSELTGGPFETLKEFNVEANSTLQIPITFKPKTIGMHEGRVMFWPIGESVLYVTLIGVATQPNPNGTITITVPAKELYTEEFLVYNITEFSESYLVTTEVVGVTPPNFAGYYEITHADTIKTWGEAAATCRWKFVCYEECQMDLKVIFINELNKEYQFYNISVTVTPSPIVDTLTFECRARECVQNELIIKNPLNVDADYVFRCENLHIPETLKITRNSEALLTMKYSPLVVGVSEDFLEVHNHLVGSFFYKAILKCLPAKEKNIEITASFGTSTPMRLRVENRTDVRADFTFTTSHPNIVPDRDIYTLWPLEKNKFLVMFEPIDLGTQMCRVSFDSPTAGEFIYNIKGVAKQPKPQGPYVVQAGGFIIINFKNIFSITRIFKIYVDNKEFYVKSMYESVQSKKELQIPVYLSDPELECWETLPTGSLTVETCEPPEPKVNWTYFLQGAL